MKRGITFSNVNTLAGAEEDEKIDLVSGREKSLFVEGCCTALSAPELLAQQILRWNFYCDISDDGSFAARGSLIGDFLPRYTGFLFKGPKPPQAKIHQNTQNDQKNKANQLKNDPKNIQQNHNIEQTERKNIHHQEKKAENDQENKAENDQKKKGEHDQKEKGENDQKSKGEIDQKNKGENDQKNKGEIDQKNKGEIDQKNKGENDQRNNKEKRNKKGQKNLPQNEQREESEQKNDTKIEKNAQKLDTEKIDAQKSQIYREIYEATSKPSDKMLKIPTFFTSTQQYLSTFYPILLVELRQAIQRAKETDLAKHSEPVKLVSVNVRGIFIEMEFQIPVKTEEHRPGDLVLLSLPKAPLLEVPETAAPNNAGLNGEENLDNEVDPNEGSEDVIAEKSGKSDDKIAENDEKKKDENWKNEETKKDEKSKNDQNKINQKITKNDSHPPHLMAVVENCFAQTIVVHTIVSVQKFGDKNLSENAQKYQNDQDFHRIKTIIEAIQNPLHSNWSLVHLVGLATVRREVQALFAMPSLLLKRDLLNAVTPKAAPHLSIPPGLKGTLRDTYNSGQFAALLACLKPQGITLIQGPPGTGKTTTLMGILSILINSSNSRESSEKTNKGLETKSGAVGHATCRPPWMNSNFTPWQDAIEYDTEDLQHVMQYFTAHTTDSLITLHCPDDLVTAKRILVCAPSNAAVDEIVKRITNPTKKGGGIYSADGHRYNPNVVRLGPGVHSDLVEFTLDFRARLRMAGSAPDNFRSKQSRAQFQSGVKRQILMEASVVCGTLSVCGSREIESLGSHFDAVVIDEASQGVEPATLIPLHNLSKKLILIGDPRQLPATVFSSLAIKYNYDQSLFQRLEANGHVVNMLEIQYRMHPLISRFPSKEFYEGKLLDAEGIDSIVSPPLPWYSIPLFKPLVFLSLQSQHQKHNQSLINPEEVKLVCQLIELIGILLTTGGLKDVWTSKIAVISPYASQVQLLRTSIKQVLKVPDNKRSPIDVNTVDGFQGREKELVIFSAVRSGDGSVGFLADVRRMNVALTRARCNIWIVANSSFLTQHPRWASLTNYAQERQLLTHLPSEPNIKHLFIQQLANSDREMLRKHAADGLEMLDADARGEVPQKLVDIRFVGDGVADLLEEETMEDNLGAENDPFRAENDPFRVDDDTHKCKQIDKILQLIDSSMQHLPGQIPESEDFDPSPGDESRIPIKQIQD